MNSWQVSKIDLLYPTISDVSSNIDDSKYYAIYGIHFYNEEYNES